MLKILSLGLKDTYGGIFGYVTGQVAIARRLQISFRRIEAGVHLWVGGAQGNVDVE